MKDFYEFLNHSNNFFGFIILCAIIMGGLSSIAYHIAEALKRPREPKSKKQQLND